MNQEEIVRMANEAGMQLAWIATVPGSNKMKVLCDFDQVQRLVEIVAAAENEACAEKTGEFARKWWSIHCDSNKHMETTRKAHDDFCALQAAIRARRNK